MRRRAGGGGDCGLHGFCNDADADASMLLLFAPGAPGAPGAPREEYFEKVAEAVHWSEEERAEFFIKHDTYGVAD